MIYNMRMINVRSKASLIYRRTSKTENFNEKSWLNQKSLSKK